MKSLTHLVIALALAHLIVAHPIHPDSIVPQEESAQDDAEIMLQDTALPVAKTKVTYGPTGEPWDEDTRNPTGAAADMNSPAAPTNKLSVPILKEAEDIAMKADAEQNDGDDVVPELTATKAAAANPSDSNPASKATPAPKAAPAAKAAPKETKVDFQHYINDTPPPGSDVPPLPGAMSLQTGIDRFDGERGEVPIFLWTFKNYAAELSNSGFVTAGRSSEIWVGDVTHQVPDQLFATTRMKCQQASQANTEVVTSSEEMEQAESKSRSMDYDGTAEVSAEYGPVSATKTVGNSMQAGSSTQAKEYEAAAKRGYSRSAFCTIDAEAYDVTLTDDSSLHPLLVEGVRRLEAAGVNERTMSGFYNHFGTDYLTYTKLGGQCSIQIMATGSSSSTTSNSALAKESSMSMSNSFITVGNEKSSSTAGSTSAGTAKGVEQGSIVFRGGTPTGDWDDWCASVKEAPIPIKYYTAPIYGVIARIMKKVDLAKALQQHLIVREKQMKSCTQGQKWDKRANACVAGECPTGSYKTKVKSEEEELFADLVQVMQSNVAKGKPATQINTSNSAPASRAVDGNTNQKWSGNSCTHTHAANNPWWKVDLQKQYSISKVKLYNRSDCCGERLNGVQVKAGSSVCSGASSGATIEVNCGNKQASSVTVTVPGSGKILTLCEVEVFASASAPAGGQDSGSSWHVCAAKEGETCQCTGTVFYGKTFVANKPGSGAKASLSQMKASNFKEKVGVVGSIKCDNVQMGGDPLPGYYKHCLCVAEAGPKPNAQGEVCVPCSPGTYLASPNDKSCTPCAAGTYSEKSQAICKQCPPGFTSSRNSPNCPFIQGTYNILDGSCSLWMAKNDVGDDSKDNDNDSWAYWDCQSSQQKVSIKHISDNRFEVKAKGQYYLKYTSKGDADKAGSKYWATWSPNKGEIVLDVDTSGDTPTGYLRDTGKATGVVKNTEGDHDIPCGRRRSNGWKCPWASLKPGHGNKLKFVNAMP